MEYQSHKKNCNKKQMSHPTFGLYQLKLELQDLESAVQSPLPGWWEEQTSIRDLWVERVKKSTNSKQIYSLLLEYSKYIDPQYIAKWYIPWQEACKDYFNSLGISSTSSFNDISNPTIDNDVQLSSFEVLTYFVNFWTLLLIIMEMTSKIHLNFH